jgi:predicted metal-binding protein
MSALHTNDTYFCNNAACLWDCDRACVVTFFAPNKPIYVFSTINPQSAPVLLAFGDRYVQSKTGNIPHQQFPDQLKVVEIAKVPAMR